MGCSGSKPAPEPVQPYSPGSPATNAAAAPASPPPQMAGGSRTAQGPPQVQQQQAPPPPGRQAPPPSKGAVRQPQQQQQQQQAPPKQAAANNTLQGAPPRPQPVPTNNPQQQQPQKPPRRGSNGQSKTRLSIRGKKGRKDGTEGANGYGNGNNGPPLTRARVDSWAHGSDASGSQRSSHIATVEQQWKMLWKTQSHHLLDPADVPSCLGECKSRVTNRLSPTEVTMIQRRVRAILRSMPVVQQSTTKKAMGRVFSSNNSNHQNYNNIKDDAKSLAQQQHLLSWTVLQKLWRPMVVDRVDIMENAYTLMLYSSERLWPRVAEVARQTAATAKLEMDVNKKLLSKQEWTMPKPSLVPDLAEPPVLPPGVALHDLVFFMALARRGLSFRKQRLQLLFYLCLPNEQLKHFLDTHPAGGVPTWLFEVGQGQVISLASLTHYHYYGTTFLPHHQGADEHPPFVSSKSRKPISVQSNVVRNLIAKLLAKPNGNGEEDGKTTTISAVENGASPPAIATASSNGSTGSPQRRGSRQGSKLMSRISSADSNNGNVSGDDGSVHMNANNNKEETVFPPSDVMKALALAGNGNGSDYDDPELLHAAARMAVDRDAADMAAAQWTLEDYYHWAEKELDDLALDACFHRLFASSILPSFSTERNLVQSKLKEWHQTWQETLSTASANKSKNGLSPEPKTLPSPTSWGGLSGVDGRAGLGYGILYCVDKLWWDQWVAYTGFGGERRRTLLRPGDITTERLVDKDFEHHIPGTLGSFEPMKEGLVQNRDYILVPPDVWDVLFEMYGGGPPMPRMVLPPTNKLARNGDHSRGADPPNSASTEMSMMQLKLLSNLTVATQPWIINCSLCDPTQPYRRGDPGTTNIRIMAAPDQPLWRVFSEIVARCPLQSYKAYDSDGKGMGRLWKKIEPAAPQAPSPGQPAPPKEPISRYGPWNLLCKNRFGAISMTLPPDESNPAPGELSSWDDYQENWETYTGGATVQEAGLADGDQIMFEFSVLNKAGNKLLWPREAAAKAGRVRRLAEEDTEFRNLLQGLDKEGNIMLKPQKLPGLDVDAMDSAGRWYLVNIQEVDIVDEDSEEDDESIGRVKSSESRARKKVKVTFEGGHVEWIDVESDRIAKAGRFTSGEDEQDIGANGKAGSQPAKDTDAKSKGPVTVKKANSVESAAAENNKLCTYPGFGACGLSNLGNTCYMNSAVQCISYMPLLRSYLLSSQYKATGDLNKDNPLGTGGRLLEEFAELLRAMWSAKYGEKMPKSFRQKLGSINGQFSAGDQQDAQEFLNYLMDVLHEDSNKVRKKPYVEALEDDWIAQNNLPRIGDEAWRRFLRRNQSIMADVAMGQVLNTVTCPTCNHSSRNFDPFNLLSIPVPTSADVIFQVVVVRRATAANCPWTLNKPRKSDKKNQRFTRRSARPSSGPPSDSFVAEQYVVAMSRLADSSDLRQQIQKVSGIAGIRLKICRGEVLVVDGDAENESVCRTLTKIVPMTEKEGPCSQLAMKKAPNQEVIPPTVIVAFESTLKPRSMKTNNGSPESVDETDDEEDEPEPSQHKNLLPSPKEEKMMSRYLEVYGDEKECRVVDTDPFVLSKGMSRSLWPRNEKELKLGLRVDAKDKRGNWFQGSVVDIVEAASKEEKGKGKGKGESKREVVVHFDNFAKKWDETYTIDHFDEGKVQPLYSHATPRMKPADFYVHHRHTNPETDELAMFGQPFAAQCYSEWSGARAGAQILAQASRFLQYNSDWSSPIDLDDPTSMERENKANRLYEKIQTAISDLIDVLVDYDREYTRLALGLSTHSDQKSQPFRNPGFDATNICTVFSKKVNALLTKLPFEIVVTSMETAQGKKINVDPDEEAFPLSLVRTIGNFLNARQVIVLHWKEHPSDRQAAPILKDPVLYVPLPLEVDEAGVEILKKSQKAGKERAKRARPGSSGIDLGVCLTEFCKSQNLTLDDNWYCPRCKSFREGRQNMNLWRLPDVLTFHIKRFNMSARWREKISTRVNFPLTGLDLSDWCHKESPVIQQDSADSHVYDLIGVVNHYGSMTGGHYVATCKATACGKDGREEVAFDFNGHGATLLETEGIDTSPTGWRLGRAKAEQTNQGKEFAAMASRAAAESSEPLWLQFDDEIVDQLPPRHVVSEMAYVLFYRRRRITPSNIAKYSTLE